MRIGIFNLHLHFTSISGKEISHLCLPCAMSFLYFVFVVCIVCISIKGENRGNCAEGIRRGRNLWRRTLGGFAKVNLRQTYRHTYNIASEV
jgi:hypothetical protein